MISPLAAAKAYASAQQGMGVGGALDSGGLAGAGGGSFADVLKGVMTDAVQSTKAAESQMAAGVQGKTDLVNVVTAISSAENTLVGSKRATFISLVYRSRELTLRASLESQCRAGDVDARITRWQFAHFLWSACF